MKKFNKLFNTKTTSVKVAGMAMAGFHKVKTIHETRIWIEVEGLTGSFQREHVEKFTNKAL